MKNFKIFAVVVCFLMVLLALNSWNVKQVEPNLNKPEPIVDNVQEPTEDLTISAKTSYELGYNAGFDAAFEQEKILVKVENTKENYGGNVVISNQEFSDGYVQGYHEAMSRINEKLVCPYHLNH